MPAKGPKAFAFGLRNMEVVVVLTLSLHVGDAVRIGDTVCFSVPKIDKGLEFDISVSDNNYHVQLLPQSEKVRVVLDRKPKS